MTADYNGWADSREDEREELQAWEDSLAGEVPGQPPRRVDDPEEWKEHDWGTGPEWKMWKRMLDGEEGA